jgi:hypothetical protein
VAGETDAAASEPHDLGKLAIAALILLFSGGLLFFLRPIAWFSIPVMLLGLVCAGLAREWRPHEKVVATVLVVALLATPFVGAATFARDWGFGVLALVLLLPVAGIVGGVYLIVVLVRRGRRARPESGPPAIE